MLQSIRDRTHGWVAGVIISLLILSFALWGIHSYLGSNAGNTVVATVNGDEISTSQLNKAYERLRRQMQVQLGSANLPPHADEELKQRALQSLVTIQLQKQASIADDYRISSHQVDNFLEGMPELQVNGQFSLARFQQLLNSALFTASDFLDLIKTTLLTEQPRLGVIFSSFALPNEITATASLVDQKRSVQYAIIPQAYFAQRKHTITDAAVLDYYNQHQQDFKTPEQVSIEYTQLLIKDLATKINPTDEMLKSFYNENISNYTLPAKWQFQTLLIPLAENATDEDIKRAQAKIASIQQEIKKGGDFVTLARQFPDLKNNKSNSWVTFSELPAELQKNMLELTKIAVSNPIRTSNGLVLVNVTAYQDAQVQSFDTVKAKVKNAVIQQQAEEKFVDARDKMANISYEHPDSLEPVSKELGLKIFTSTVFTREKGGTDSITSSKIVREAAFANDVLNSQNNSDVIQVSPDTAVVIRVKSHQPAALLPIKTVQKQIIDKLQAQQIETETQQLANEVQQKLQKGDQPSQIASQYHITWKKANLAERHANQIDSAILYAAFRLPRPQPTQKSAALYATVKVPEGYAVVTVTAAQDGNIANKDQYDVFAEQVQNSFGLLEYELYKQSLMDKAKISVNDQASHSSEGE